MGVQFTDSHNQRIEVWGATDRLVRIILCFDILKAFRC